MFVRSIDPRSGQLVKETACTYPHDVPAIMAKAKAAQRSWAALPKQARIDVMLNAETIFTRERDALLNIIQSEGGFPKKGSMGAYNSALKGFAYYVQQYQQLDAKPFPLDPKAWVDTEATIQYVPHGVIGHIGIWNYPFWQTMITAIPALLVGNAVVFKPSEYTTLTGLRIAQLWHEAGVPEGVFVPVVGGPELGRELVRSDFDALVFTGGVNTGMDIIRNGGIKPMILELSGNDPAIICSDADLDQAVRGVANGTFSHGGQVCIRVKRVYVVESLAEKFIHLMVDIARRLDVREQVGPLIREDSRAKVHAAVQKAVASGAMLMYGGVRLEGPGYYYMPTVLVVRKDVDVRFDDEIFGPVCPIIIVKDEDEAVRLANDSKYGLGATVWTSDQEKGQRIAAQIEAGTVWINECGRTLTGGDYFQGWKSSGIASSSDRLGLFLKKRAVIHHRSCQPRDHWMK